MAQLTGPRPVDPPFSEPPPPHGRLPYPPPAARRDPGHGAVPGFLERLWRHPAWLAPLVVLSCFAGVSGLLLAADPTDGRQDLFGGCALKVLTGFDCPGCGGTRAYWYLLHANLPEAARHHVVAVFMAPFLVYLYVAWTLHRIIGLRLPELRITPRLIVWFLAAWGVFSVLRNLPWEPFTLLYV